MVKKSVLFLTFFGDVEHADQIHTDRRTKKENK